MATRTFNIKGPEGDMGPQGATGPTGPQGATGPVAPKDIQILVTDPHGDSLAVGDGQAYFTIPASLNGYNITSIHAALTTVSTSGNPTIQVARIRSGVSVDVLSTKVTIDANTNNSYIATTPPVINTSNDDVQTGDIIRVDVDVAGSGARGLMVLIAIGV